MASDINSTAITIDELKRVLSSLKMQKETISNTYNNMIVSVLDSSASCFSFAGLDYSRIQGTFSKTFAELDNKFDKLINLLENNVIRNYSELAIAIRQLFNKDFANKMEDLLGIK